MHRGMTVECGTRVIVGGVVGVIVVVVLWGGDTGATLESGDEAILSSSSS